MAEITLAGVAKELEGSPVFVTGTTKGTYRVVVDVPTLAIAAATASALKEAIGKLDKGKVTWRQRVLAASEGKMRAIARCVLDSNSNVLTNSQFYGKASITLDGFIMCDFIDRNGAYHHGAFVGDVSDMRENVIGIADFLDLSESERNEWFAACKAWIAADYSGNGLGL